MELTIHSPARFLELASVNIIVPRSVAIASNSFFPVGNVGFVFQ
jgi:hypothetical protein